MTHQEIRSKFLDFFEKREHKIMPSSSLIPEDKSVLFTTAGMQQFKKYYLNPEQAPAKNIASIQKCMRTSDIDEVGDESHLTFFEMLGNFSFGGYGKEKAITLGLEFLINKMEGMGLDYSRISATYYSGDKFSGVDIESKSILQNQNFIKDRVEGKNDNIWGPTGNEGPCGPTVEFYVDGFEVWNIVFNEFYCDSDKSFKPLKDLGVDTGMGLERLAMVVQKKNNIFEADLFESLVSILSKADTNLRRKRIIIDHARASMFLISDGVRPSNKERGHILRRLLRRMIVQAHIGSFGSFSGADTLSLGAKMDIDKAFDKIYEIYSNFYPDLSLDNVKKVFNEEFNKFDKTFKQGLKEIKNLNLIDVKSAFKLYESFGLTYEIIKDIGDDKTNGLTREAFDEEFRKHQELSRVGAEKKFKKQ